MLFPCQLCKEECLKKVLILENQPISNRFLGNKEDEEDLYPIQLFQCLNCGLIQLFNPITWKKMVPKYSWISYNEPEKHLDSLVEKIISLPNVDSDSSIMGVSYKESSTLDRLKNKGFDKINCLNKEDLGIESVNFGIESIQANLTKERSKKITDKYGLQDVVIARHILEHAQNPHDFMGALKNLLKPTGYLVLEVPDTAYCLEQNIYTMIWEEHALYFTPFTFENFFPYFDLKIHLTHSYEYPIENSLIAIVKHGDKVVYEKNDKKINNEIERAKLFAENFQKHKTQLHDFFSRHSSGVAFLGAGHHASAFINYFDLSQYVSFVADDNPYKQGLFMPGSRLPILNSSSLQENKIGLCLTALSPESEERVIAKNSSYLNSGGDFVSIFSGNEKSLRKIIENYFKYNLKKTGDGVFYSTNKNTTITPELIEFLKMEADKAKSKRARICVHENSSDKLHDMLIVLSNETYVRPHMHLKPESGHIIEGEADLVFFDKEGGIEEVKKLSSNYKDKFFFYRINSPTFHTQVVKSKYLVFHETTTGPFVESETVYASWAPPESNGAEVIEYKNKLVESLKSFKE